MCLYRVSYRKSPINGTRYHKDFFTKWDAFDFLCESHIKGLNPRLYIVEK